MISILYKVSVQLNMARYATGTDQQYNTVYSLAAACTAVIF